MALLLQVVDEAQDFRLHAFDSLLVGRTGLLQSRYLAFVALQGQLVPLDQIAVLAVLSNADICALAVLDILDSDRGQSLLFRVELRVTLGQILLDHHLNGFEVGFFGEFSQ